MNNKFKGMFDLTKTTFYTNTTNGRGHSKTYQMIEQLQQENFGLKKQIEIMEKYLELIVDLGFDFDGCNTVKSLKGLVEELTHFASLARACNLTETIYENGGKKYNILHEEIEEDSDDKL